MLVGGAVQVQNECWTVGEGNNDDAQGCMGGATNARAVLEDGMTARTAMSVATNMGKQNL